MTNQEPDVIIVDDSIFYEIEEMIDKKIKELEAKKKTNQQLIMKQVMQL